MSLRASTLDAVRSPKLRGRSSWYPYYAAFDGEFVDDVLGLLGTDHGPVLDPWNGSGTTTSRAQRIGLSSVGYDLNPACVVVARARLLSKDVGPSLVPLANDLVDHARDLAGLGASDDEPLRNWLTVKTAARIRALEGAIRGRLTSNDDPASDAVFIEELSSLAAFYYVVLFSVVRELTATFRTSNPTWVKTSGTPVSADWRQIASSFKRAVRALARKCEPAPANRGAVILGLGDASHLPIEAATIGAVFSSPPYATRIDYVVSTRPELAVLGLGESNAEARLRKSMLGTTMMVSHSPKDPGHSMASPTAEAFLAAVRAHPSKASDSYYARYFHQYFAGLSGAIAELDRVCVKGAPIALVVQDSYYKEIRLDLPKVIGEMVTATGRTNILEKSFSTGTRAAINPNARKYRSAFRATETLVVARSV